MLHQCLDTVTLRYCLDLDSVSMQADQNLTARIFTLFQIFSCKMFCWRYTCWVCARVIQLGWKVSNTGTNVLTKLFNSFEIIRLVLLFLVENYSKKTFKKENVALVPVSGFRSDQMLNYTTITYPQNLKKKWRGESWREQTNEVMQLKSVNWKIYRLAPWPQTSTCDIYLNSKDAQIFCKHILEPWEAEWKNFLCVRKNFVSFFKLIALALASQTRC